MWGSGPSQQWENFFWVTVLQSVGHPLVSEGFDLTMTVPLALSYCSFFVFGHGISFFGGFQHPPVDQPVVQQPMVIVVLSEEMSTRPSTPPS